MPRLSEFYGIVMSMYVDDVGQHSLPHVYAQYAEHRAVCRVDSAAWSRRGPNCTATNWCAPGSAP